MSDKPPCSPQSPCRRVTSPKWDESQCRWCWRKKYRNAGNELPKQLPCSHRSDRQDDVKLKSCNGRFRMFPSFACSLHGQCVLYGTCDEMQLAFVAAIKRGETPDLWQCNLCKERIAD